MARADESFHGVDAETYQRHDWVNEPRLLEAVRAAVDEAMPARRPVLLYVGTGTGAVLAVLAQMKGVTVGLDIHRDMLRVAHTFVSSRTGRPPLFVVMRMICRSTRTLWTSSSCATCSIT